MSMSATCGARSTSARPRLRAVQKHVDRRGAAARQPPRAIPRFPGPEMLPDKLRRIFGFIASSYLRRWMPRHDKTTPGTGLERRAAVRGSTIVPWRALAFPFMLNSAVQAVLNATDTWFIGRVSPAATSAHRRSVLAGAGVRTAVRRRRPLGADVGGAGVRRASLRARLAGDVDRAVGLVVHGALVCRAGARRAPGSSRPSAFRRKLCSSLSTIGFRACSAALLAIALWSLLGFFNGIGRPTVTLRITLSVAVVNAVLNQLFMFDLGMGVAGSGWATDAAQLIGVARGGSSGSWERPRASATARTSPTRLARTGAAGAS